MSNNLRIFSQNIKKIYSNNFSNHEMHLKESYILHRLSYHFFDLESNGTKYAFLENYLSILFLLKSIIEDLDNNKFEPIFF
tara:strand:+ start:313 stop:555 length:243 start_codon:yes stop_codon:yes gene_type:complete